MENEGNVGLISPRQLYKKLNATLDTPVGIHAVYELVKRRSFPSVKIGGRYYVVESKVREWFENQSRSRL